jgi:hypothetical protein
MNKDSKYYRDLKAVREGRTPGTTGRPPLLEATDLDILYSRIRQKILSKEQVTKSVLVEMVSFLFV